MKYMLFNSSRLGQAARRLFPIYGYYRRLCALADQMSETERLAYQARELERVSCLASAAGNATSSVLTKEKVRDEPQAFLRRTLWPVASAATGGTTGLPMTVERSFNAVIFEQATIDHIAARQGVDLAASKTAVFRGDDVKRPDDVEPPFSVAAGPSWSIFSSTHLSDENGRAVLSELAQFRPDVLSCYPSTLKILIRLARETRTALRPKIVMTSSKVLPQELFGEVAATFGCPLVDFYGQAERVCFAWASEAGAYRFRHEYGQAILTNPGLRGVICGTGFVNRRQILINYSTGDLLSGADELTDHELRAVAIGIKPFAGIDGRQNDVMILPDGRQIVGFNQVQRFVEGADYIQILRTGVLELEVVIVKNHHYTEATRTHIERNLRLKLPSSVKTVYRFAELPVRTSSGKTPTYIDAYSSARTGA